MCSRRISGETAGGGKVYLEGARTLGRKRGVMRLSGWPKQVKCFGVISKSGDGLSWIHSFRFFRNPTAHSSVNYLLTHCIAPSRRSVAASTDENSEPLKRSLRVPNAVRVQYAACILVVFVFIPSRRRDFNDRSASRTSEFSTDDIRANRVSRTRAPGNAI